MKNLYTHYASLHNIKVKTPFKLILEEINVSIHRGQKIGLIGNNGSGKTTLLKIINKTQSVSEGKLELYGTVWYLPQLNLELFQSKQSLSEYLYKELDEWWNVIEILEKKYNFIIDTTKELNHFSGGELVKIHIAMAEVINPDILLMDEPNNHLDIDSQIILQNFIKEYQKSIIVASHNVYLLNQTVNRIWELYKGKIREFGGNYDFYQEQKNLEEQAKLRKFELALKKKSKLNRSITIENTRFERNKAFAKQLKQDRDRGISRMDKGYFKSKSQVRAGQKKLMFQKRVEQNQENLDLYKPDINPYINYDIISNKDFSGKHILEIRKGNISINQNILISNINLDIEYGERIVILGRNGVGKTSLLKSIHDNQKEYLTGNITKSINARIEYISQNYDLVDPNQTLIENMKRYNPKASQNNIRNRLRDFLFFEEEVVNKYSKELSGGETARLAFAMITLNSVEAILLDEPTNNLDINAKDSIIKSLAGFPGSVIVVSHDINFLSKLNINTTYCIKNNKLVKIDLEYTKDNVLDEIQEII